MCMHNVFVCVAITHSIPFNDAMWCAYVYSHTYTAVLVGCREYVWSSFGFGSNEHPWLALVPWNRCFSPLLGVVHFSCKLSTCIVKSSTNID